MSKLKIIFIFLSITYIGYAQDIHFSQYNTSPLLLNPASTGALSKDYRIAINYKSQWGAVSDNGYKTFAGSFDTKILKKGKQKKNYLGIGITAFSDKAGTARLATTQANIYLAYNLKVSQNMDLSAGFTGGFIQRSIVLSNLKWDNQFDGNSYDPSRASGENYASQKNNVLDLGTGLLCRYYNKESQFKIELGGSASHLNKSKKTFYNQPNKINMKFVGTLNTQIKLGDRPTYICPQLIYINQKPNSEIIVGGSVKHLLGQETRSKTSLNTFSLVSSIVELGVYYRLKDAVIINAALEYKKTILLGISYDINISKLHTASKYKGGMELALVFKGLFSQSSIKQVPLD